MSRIEEGRYGRVCLLVLNVCPFTLRHVIDDYCLRYGSLSLSDFLEKNKHSLFHQFARECCCRNLPKTRSTPMCKHQWESLFIKNTSSCRKGKQFDCPCQFDSKQGITTKGIDVTMCCLLINSTCHGVDIKHISTIREIRNNLIHRERACLDQRTYNGYWNRVKTAICQLAKSVSSVLHRDTVKMIEELETRIMDSDELGELRNLMVDEQRFTDLKEDISGMADSLEQTRDEMTQISQGLTKKVKQVQDETQKKMSQIQRDVGKEIKELQEELRPIQQKSNEAVQGVTKMKKRLMEINEKVTRVVQLSPLQDTGDELPIELLYATVVIREDKKYETKADASSQRKKDLTRQTKQTLHTARQATQQTPDFDIGSFNYDMPKHIEVTQPKDIIDFKIDGYITEEYNMREVTDPNDIFKKDGKYARRIYMLGDAAHGKTTYCLWLLRKWCDAKEKERMGQVDFDKWEEEMRRFDFVFLIKFRNIHDPNLVSVKDMICQDAFESDIHCHDAIRCVLSSDEYQSFIIMDGLDEWYSNSESNMPNIDVSGSVTCFISMRPWVFPLLLKKPQHSDRVIEILGLSESGMENVIKNVLINRYELNEDSPKYTHINDKILKYLEDDNVKSLMQIPLLAVVCVQIWYEGKQVGDGMTSFYAEMLNMLIERAHEKHRIDIKQHRTVGFNSPEIFSEHENIESCFSVLLKLAKVAYEGLLSSETNLVFQKRKLEREIGERELQFALDVGLISQKEARSLTTKNVSVNFFHKSIQEFLAVIYIVTNKDVSDSFCKRMSNVNFIMELSNVIMFICGMCPSMGTVISQRVVSVIDSDTEICKYRQSAGINIILRELYRLQVRCYKELKYRWTDSPLTCHVSDIYVDENCDIEAAMVTRELFSDQSVDIRSLVLLYVPTNGTLGIPNKELNEFLSNKHNNTRSLVMVEINGDDTERSLHHISIPTLKTLYLHNVKINIDLDVAARPPLLKDMESLQVFGLVRITLDNRELGMSKLTSLRVLVLDTVTLVDRELTFSGLKSLRELRLSRMTLGKTGLDLSDVPSLHLLNLYMVDLGNIGLDLSPLTSLRELLLTDVTLGYKGLNLSNMTQLRVLQLREVLLVDRGLDLIDLTSLRELRLYHIALGKIGLDLSYMTSLRKLLVSHVTLDVRGLMLHACMVNLDEVRLVFVDMSAEQWQQFILSVLNIRHKFNVVLRDSVIDYESKTKIRSAQDYNLTRDGVGKHGKYMFDFTRVWPL